MRGPYSPGRALLLVVSIAAVAALCVGFSVSELTRKPPVPKSASATTPQSDMVYGNTPTLADTTHQPCLPMGADCADTELDRLRSENAKLKRNLDDAVSHINELAARLNAQVEATSEFRELWRANDIRTALQVKCSDLPLSSASNGVVCRNDNGTLTTVGPEPPTGTVPCVSVNGGLCRPIVPSLTDLGKFPECSDVPHSTPEGYTLRITCRNDDGTLITMGGKK